MFHFRSLRIITLASAFTCIAALTGCDGTPITITIEPKSSSSPVSSSLSSYDSSNSSLLHSSSSIRSSNSSEDSKSSIYLRRSSSTDSFTSSSSSSIDVYDDCNSPNYVGAPSCWRITEEPCPEEGCKVTYETSDFCGVRLKNATHIFDGYDPSRCEALNNNLDNPLCKQINGRTYHSLTLQDHTITESGVQKARSTLTFDQGVLRISQPEFELLATYACQDNQIIVTSDKEEILDISQNLSTLQFSPAFDDNKLEYVFADAQPNNTACETVAGHRYSSEARSINTTNDVTLPEQGPTFFEFSKEINKVTYSYGDILEEGYYDCALGEMQIHPNGRANTPPLVVEVGEAGESITITGEASFTLFKEFEPLICTLEYEPVCVAQPVQCLVAPCPDVHATRGNQCQAGDLPVLFKGECGDLEGQPVIYDDTDNCSTDDQLFCVKGIHPLIDIACVTEPCPMYSYFNVANECEAERPEYKLSFEGECESIGLTEHLTFDDQPVRLFNLDPLDDTVGKKPLPRSEGIEILESSIQDDVLTLKLGYSGCTEQPIYYNIDGSTLLESLPPQTGWSLNKSVEDLCLAYFESTYTYDLLPLRALFKDHVESDYGLGILGLSLIYKR